MVASQASTDTPSREDVGVVTDHGGGAGQHAEHQTGQRAGSRDAELGPRPLRIGADPGVAPHQPQDDAVHGQALVPGDDGVAHLVDHDAAEEGHRGERAGSGVGAGRIAGGVEGEPAAAEPDGEEGGHDQRATS